MRCGGLIVLFLLAISSVATAQRPPQPGAARPQPAPQWEDLGTVGPSAAAVIGPWKFAPGDSPWSDGGTPAWAQPGFDDAGWAAMDIEPKEGSLDWLYGTAGFVPGWTARGYPSLRGFAWYRVRIRVRDAGQPLWLKMPVNFDDGYQLFANGQYVGEFGDFGPHHRPTTYWSRARSFALPAPGANGEMVLALRFYMERDSALSNYASGGMHQPPIVGLRASIGRMQASDDAANLQGTIVDVFADGFILLAALAALWAWLIQRRGQQRQEGESQDRTYLLLVIALLLTLARSAVLVVARIEYVISYSYAFLLVDAVLVPLSVAFWILFWRRWFDIRSQWEIDATWLATAVEMAAFACLHVPLYGWVVPQAWTGAVIAISVACRVATGVLLVWLLVRGGKADRTAALLASIPVLLLLLSLFGNDLLIWFGINTTYFPFGVAINIGQIASVLMILVIGVLAAQRLFATQVGRELRERTVQVELEQARELQQHVLIPEAIASERFAVQTEYRPAQLVGGDFFQVITRNDGCLLVALGDVSGKGISAAMLVAVLVGALRTRADETFAPEEILATLNERLAGRAGGHFATCIVAQLFPHGEMRVANAGHLPVYRNGRALGMGGALPLGITDELSWEVQRVELAPGDRLTFLTDGVPEARNASGELYGFEATEEISGLPADAIASRASAFGQEDDITVLSVVFHGGERTVAPGLGAAQMVGAATWARSTASG